MSKVTQVLVLRSPWDKESGEYSVPGTCLNCGWEGTITLPLGREAPRGYRSARCKVCGCKTVNASIRRTA